jgi:hypothetical protein
MSFNTTQNIKDQTVEELRQRVITGNEKMLQYWKVLISSDSEKYNQNIERYESANKKLINLCDLLELKGYNQCLYMSEGKKTRKCFGRDDESWCVVCPASDEIIKKAKIDDYKGREQMNLL